jgi:hypothetical protein
LVVAFDLELATRCMLYKPFTGTTNIPDPELYPFPAFVLTLSKTTTVFTAGLMRETDSCAINATF